ncbi:unnamed protein product [Closterium sp. NIES-65]|nr:unnamed protein product [Closterium sp. NIES-65]
MVSRQLCCVPAPSAPTCLPPRVCPHVSAPTCLPPRVCPYVSTPCFCPNVPNPTCLCLPPRACVCPHVPVSAPTCLCLPPRACVCPHVPVSAPTCLCLPPRACVCPHVPVSAPTCVSADVCTVRNYGPNSRCLKNEAGWANCECERGLNLLPNASCARTHAYSAVRQGTPTILPFLSVRQGTPAILPFLSLSCTLTRSLLIPGLMDCGENAYCEKEQDRAVCHCNWGYAMTDTGCVDTCILQACGENGRCVKDAAGMASCVCDIGFTLQDDGRTCIGKDAVPCCVRVLLRPSVFCCCVSHVLTCSLPFFPNLSTSSSLSLYRFLSLFLYLFLYLFL